MHLVQKDLDMVKREWNSHLIRRSKNTSAPAGHPDELYHLPQILGMLDAILHQYSIANNASVIYRG